MPTTQTVGPVDIWNALIGAGASPAQAAGIMGNMQAESGLNTQSAGRDSNGAWSYGLINWNTASYPNAASLVTGNPTTDLANQINFLKQTGGFNAAVGNDPGTIASNFAHTYERCSACGYQGGTAQLQIRSANAQSVFQAAGTGKWPTGGASLTSAAGGADSAGGIKISLPVLGDVTLLSVSQIKTVKAFAFIGTGGTIMVLGFGVLLAALGGVTPSKVAGGNPGVKLAQAPIRASKRRTAERTRQTRTAEGEQRRQVRAYEGEQRTIRGEQRKEARDVRTSAAKEQIKTTELKKREKVRTKQTRRREEARSEGVITRAEGRAAASRYRTAPVGSEAFN